MWEYNKVNLSYKSSKELIQQLNEYGKDGWEVIHYSERTSDKLGTSNKAIVLMKRLKK